MCGMKLPGRARSWLAVHLGTEPGAARLALDCDDFEWLGPREPGIKTSTPITAPTAAITNTTALATALRLRRHRRASLKRTSGDGGPTACAGRVIVGDLAIAQRTVSIIAMTSLLRLSVAARGAAEVQYLGDERGFSGATATEILCPRRNSGRASSRSK